MKSLLLVTVAISMAYAEPLPGNNTNRCILKMLLFNYILTAFGRSLDSGLDSLGNDGLPDPAQDNFAFGYSQAMIDGANFLQMLANDRYFVHKLLQPGQIKKQT